MTVAILSADNHPVKAAMDWNHNTCRDHAQVMMSCRLWSCN